ASEITDISFVALNFTAELASDFALQRKSDPLKHEPCGLLSDSSSAGNLITAHAVLAVSQHPHCEEPLVQSDRRLLKDRSNLDGKLRLRVARLALPETPRRNKGNVFASARWADNALRPSATHKVRDAVIRISKIDDCVLQRLWFGHGIAPHRRSV